MNLQEIFGEIQGLTKIIECDYKSPQVKMLAVDSIKTLSQKGLDLIKEIK